MVENKIVIAALTCSEIKLAIPRLQPSHGFLSLSKPHLPLEGKD